MKCPKCAHINLHGATECDSCGVQFVDIRAGRGSRSTADRIDRTCPFNDHGNICGLIGSLSDTTNGQGPWYCSRHFWKLKGYPETSRAEFEAALANHVTVRDRWYEENDEPPMPANLDGTAHLRPMADPDGALLARLHSGELGKRTRQPGED